MQVAGAQTQEPKAKNHTPAAKSQDLEPRTSASEKARGRRMYGKWLSAAACLFFIVLAAAGYRFYFSATAVISIDVNPSIELNINRFDTVISVKAYNEDGQKLADQLHVRFMKYMDAFRAIVDSEDLRITGQRKSLCPSQWPVMMKISRRKSFQIWNPVRRRRKTCIVIMPMRKR